MFHFTYFQAVRPPPLVPQTVKYYNLGEVKQAALKVAGDWSVLRSTDALLVLGLYDHTCETLHKKIVINADLTAAVTLGGNKYN